MAMIKVSATKARNNFFELLNQVALGMEFIIEKDKKEIAVIGPSRTKTDWEGLLKASHEAHGILKKYNVQEISPLRKKSAWKRLGKWDKGLTSTK